MVYGGALASGALTHEFDVLGWHATGFARLPRRRRSPGCSGTSSARSAAGGSATAAASRSSSATDAGSISPRRGSTAPSAGSTRWNDWAVFARASHAASPARSSPSRPGVFESPFRRYNVLTLAGNSIWCLVLAAIGWALGSNWDTVPPRLPLGRVRRRGGNRAVGGVLGPSTAPHGYDFSRR